MVLFEVVALATVVQLAAVMFEISAITPYVMAVLTPFLSLLFGGSDEENSSNIEGEATAATGPQLALILTISAVALSALQILQHLMSYHHPRRQRYAIRIMLMVPIYAIDSLWAYAYFREADFIVVARDTYEAYVLYNFFWLIMDFMGGEEAVASKWKEYHEKNNKGNNNGAVPTMDHMFPGNYIYGKKFNLDIKTLRNWRLCLIQYVLLSPLLTFVQYVGTWEGIFDESSWSITDLHLYISIIRCVSVTYAFTALLYLYLSCKKIIHDYNPTGKFIAIKLVVFLSFWQSIVIGYVGSYNLLPKSLSDTLMNWTHEAGSHNIENVESGLENLLLCLEMFITAVLHHFVFSHYEHDPENPINKNENITVNEAPLLKNIAHAFSVGDVLDETKHSKKVTQKAAKKQVDNAKEKIGKKFQ